MELPLSMVSKLAFWYRYLPDYVAKIKLQDVNGNARELILNNALYVPSYKQDIFSVNAAVEEGGSISLDQRNKRFKSSDGAAFNIEQVGRLYYLKPARF